MPASERTSPAARLRGPARQAVHVHAQVASKPVRGASGEERVRRANTGHRDANEAEIVAALRAAGAAVAVMAPPMPDLLVQHMGRVIMIEVKDAARGERVKPHKRNSAGDVPACLTPAQVTWWRAWIAQGGEPPVILIDVDQALAAIIGSP
jgi:hypothetical protein